MRDDQKNTLLTFVLDETGWMHSIADDAVGGFKSFDEGLAQDGGACDVTLLKFDSNHQTVVCCDVPPS